MVTAALAVPHAGESSRGTANLRSSAWANDNKKNRIINGSSDLVTLIFRMFPGQGRKNLFVMYAQGIHL